MTRIEIVTLTAEYVETRDDDDYENTGWVVLNFGGTEITRWPAGQTWFRYEDDQREHVEQFVAGKFAAVLALIEAPTTTREHR